MKKIIPVILAGLLFAVLQPVKCQTIPTKYVKGWGTELNFNPFDGSLSLNNAAGQIKVRRFLKNDIALRASIAIVAKNENSTTKLVYGQVPYDGSDKKHSFLTSINLGAEKHFNNEKRLSPYLGFEVGVGFKVSKQELGYNSTKKTVEGAWEYQYLYYNGQYYNTELGYEERGFTSTNANLFTGFDFYMADNFYFGYELGFGFEFIKYSKISITKDIEYPGSDLLPDLDTKNWSIGPRLVNGIRLGYNF
jgi:hypothetical protein